MRSTSGRSSRSTLERHVDAVHVGALFAVHLDGHVMAVHQGGDLFVLEALALHDVAPVAGGVADGKEDGLVLNTRRLESLFTPGIPIHRVVSVLQQIGTLLLSQTVGMHDSPLKAAAIRRRRRPRRVEGTSRFHGSSPERAEADLVPRLVPASALPRENMR